MHTSMTWNATLMGSLSQTIFLSPGLHKLCGVRLHMFIRETRESMTLAQTSLDNFDA
jgi:hypothetical protein